MRRRTLLQMPALGLAQTKPGAFKLSVRVEPVFPKLSLPQQMEKVAEARYQGFEFGNWRAAAEAGGPGTRPGWTLNLRA